MVNDAIRFADIRDGTSNTYIVCEQSDYTYDASGRQRGNRTSNYYGGWFGSRHPRTIHAGRQGCGDLWQTGTTCVRFGINAHIFQTGANDHMYRNNTLICSSHPGGAHLLLTDGSVRFASETMNLRTLKQLACRYDGEPIESW